MSFLDCRHKVGLELARARGELRWPDSSGDAALAAKHGLAHEDAYLHQLEAEGLRVVTLPDTLGCGAEALLAAAQHTMAAMADGADVIFQATFFDGTWQGRADFLRRVETPSALGEFSYEAHDTKLARSTKVSALLQLGVYSLQLEAVQGVMPASMHVVLGDGSVESIPTGDVVSYTQRMMGRLIDALDHDSTFDVYPVPVAHCAICPWAPRCEEHRLVDDHLSGLPGIRSMQVNRLEAAGYDTIAALGTPPAPPAVPRMAPETAANLHALAQLQVVQRAGGDPAPMVRLKPPTDGGLVAIPAPSAGDLFFDLEGDPYLGDHGREYLWGWCDVAGDVGYVAAWGHDEAGEKAAVEDFLDLVTERLEHHPDLHIYHYAAYEITALKRLTATYGTREDVLDELLRAEVFVDLFSIARRGLWVSTPSYSIKDLERFYRPARATEVTSGMASVVAYEEWLESQDPQVLADIEAYNRDDCVSTLELRDWLLELRGEAPVTEAEAEPEDAPKLPDERELRRRALVDQLAASGHASDELLAGLLGYFEREQRPEWWAHFARLEMTASELTDDTESIGGLTADGTSGTIKQSTLHRFRFDPAQESKMAAGDKVVDPANDEKYEIHSFDPIAGELELKVGNRRDAPTCGALIPEVLGRTEALEDALLDLADDALAAEPTFAAGHALLRRDLPTIEGHAVGNGLVANGEPPGDAVVRLGQRLDRSYLAVQGPPGAGKSHAGGELIRTLVAAGKKVGVVGNSHAVVLNLLRAVVGRARAGLPVLKVGGEAPLDGSGIEHRSSNAATRNEILAATDGLVVGGTAWLFAHAELRRAFDVLVVDEAGQLSLAHTLASSVSARSIVLLGDPQQLDQPVKGSHPPGTATSALGHLLGEDATVATDRGVFLDQSWRMSPPCASR